MSSAIAFPDNLFKLANYVTLTFSGGATAAISVDAAYPVENMFSPDPSKVTRINYTRNATPAVDIRIRVRLSTTDSLLFTALAALNVRLDPHVTVATLTRGTVAGAASAFDLVAYPAANILKLDGTTDRCNLYAIRTNAALRGEIWLTLTAPINVSGYVEIGHMWASSALVLAEGVDREWTTQPLDGGTIKKGRAGNGAASIVPRRKRLMAPITGREYVEIMGTDGTPGAMNLDDILTRAGNTIPMLFIGADEDLHRLQKVSCYGYIEQTQAIGHSSTNYFGTKMTIDEIRG